METASFFILAKKVLLDTNNNFLVCKYIIFAGNYTLLGILPDFLGVGDVLVRADDHAVLLVHELVHLGTYLLDGGFHLLAVDVDGYPAGA